MSKSTTDQALSALHRVVQSSQKKPSRVQHTNRKKTRPEDVRSCDVLQSAYRHRQDILEEVGLKVEQIQLASELPEDQLRSLNEEINTLISEKRRWEVRILELGGRDFIGGEDPTKDQEYLYFGAARRLAPDDTTAEEPSTQIPDPLRDPWQLDASQLNESYFGMLDVRDEFGLLTLENHGEAEAIAKSSRIITPHPAEWKVVDSAFVLPDPADIQKAILEKRKRETLLRFGLSS